MGPFVLVGGSGFVGTGVALRLLAAGRPVHVVDRHPPRPDIAAAGATFASVDLLCNDLVAFFAGVRSDAHVVVLAGSGDPQLPEPWVHALHNVATTARLVPALHGRRTTLISTVQVYGDEPGPHGEDDVHLPWSDAELGRWAERLARRATDGPCYPHRVAAVCRELAAADIGDTWTYALSKRAQELLLDYHGDGTTILRLANVIGHGQQRVVTRFARQAAAGRPIDVTVPSVRSFLLAEHVAAVLLEDPGPGIFNLGSPPVPLLDVARLVVEYLGSSSELRTDDAEREPAPQIDRSRLAAVGLDVAPLSTWLPPALDRILADPGPVFHPPLPVVTPARPRRPDEIADRHQATLWSGEVKHGNRWTTTLERTLADFLDVGPGRRLLATGSGTDALRIGIGATVGRGRGRSVAMLPSFTFPATAEVLTQLGYQLRFVDVDDRTWTMDPDALDQALLAEPQAALVLCVDTFGHPCDYPALVEVCARHRVPLVADSAAALGSRLDDRPIADQALVHCFSMSFAKVLSAGGAGGAVVLPTRAALDDHHGWTRSALMNELHAVAALDQLVALDHLVDRRIAAASRYAETCAAIGLDHQQVAPDARHSWVHFVLSVPGGAERRDWLGAELAALGVETKRYFRPLHRHGFGHLPGASRHRLPVTDRLDASVLAVPMSSELSTEQIERVAAAIEQAWNAVRARPMGEPAVAEPPTASVLRMSAG